MSSRSFSPAQVSLLPADALQAGHLQTVFFFNFVRKPIFQRLYLFPYGKNARAVLLETR